MFLLVCGVLIVPPTLAAVNKKTAQDLLFRAATYLWLMKCSEGTNLVGTFQYRTMITGHDEKGRPLFTAWLTYKSFCVPQSGAKS